MDLYALNDMPATLTIHHRRLGTRHLSGVVAASAREGTGTHATAFSVTLMPALHRLGLTSDCRIFQQISVPDIIRKILGEHGVTDAKLTLSGPHLEREYCVQYRETHLAFLERIMAEEGIWYFHAHGREGQHTLHIVDATPALKPCPDQPTLPYRPVAGGIGEGAWCTGLTVREEIRPTAYAQRDFTFKRPAYDQHHSHDGLEDNGAKADYALYDYPGRYKEDPIGKAFTQARLEAARVGATTAHGRANTPHLVAGHTVELTGAATPPDPALGKYHLLGVHHAGSQPQAAGAGAGEGAATYGCTFTAIPARLPYRPPPSAPPVVAGPQTAVVVGPQGEEIHTDEHGRVKVRFHWDRYATGDEHSSCWIRVAQLWAGTRFGAMFLPRIGHEVVVEFLDGDPDQPLITGRVYNAANRTPYPLPAKKTVSTIKSRSHQSAGANELRFDDATGDEEIFLHAQKDLETRVLNDAREAIGRDRHKIVKRDPLGYFHIDIAEVRTQEGKLYLLVAIDRTSKFAFVELHEKATRRVAGDFLRALAAPVPYKIHTVLTDNVLCQDEWLRQG